MSSAKKSPSIEIVAAAIGCLGVVGAAIVTGFFGFLNILVPQVISRTPATTPTIIVITATPAPVAKTFGTIIFAPGVTSKEPTWQAVGARARYPEGVANVYAVIPVLQAVEGAQWRYEWAVNGQVRPNLGSAGWTLTLPGATWANVWESKGLETGEWEIRVLVGNQVVQKSSFVVEARQPNASFVTTIRFAEDNQADKPVNAHRPIDRFKTGVTKVWAFFDVNNLPKGTPWKWEWYRDGDKLTSVGGSKNWEADANEKDWWLNISDEDRLKSGTYELRIYIADRLAQVGTFVVE